MGSLHNIDSVCSGRPGAVPGRNRVPVPGTDSGNRFCEPGSGNQFWEPGPGFDGFRQVFACPRFRRVPRG